jgi:hypothetical protein
MRWSSIASLNGSCNSVFDIYSLMFVFCSCTVAQQSLDRLGCKVHFSVQPIRISWRLCHIRTMKVMMSGLCQMSKFASIRGRHFDAVGENSKSKKYLRKVKHCNLCQLQLL